MIVNSSAIPYIVICSLEIERTGFLSLKEEAKYTEERRLENENEIT